MDESYVGGKRTANEIAAGNRKTSFSAHYTLDSILGESLVIKNRKWEAERFAQSRLNLHIWGESGVGKELFAQAVHNAGANPEGPFVALNCASFPENLIESELFGYVCGAFTGASKSGQVSKFELADGGTLFLDEIGELPLNFQAKLLRVLETKTVSRIGSSESIPFDVRIISATNRDLEKMVEDNEFRRDLYYRLQVLSLEIPPLRERERDVLLIADYFLEKAARSTGDSKKVLSLEAQEEMLRYNWPGNIRELKNIIHRLTVLTEGSTITKNNLQSAIYSKGCFAQTDFTNNTFWFVNSDGDPKTCDAQDEDGMLWEKERNGREEPDAFVWQQSGQVSNDARNAGSREMPDGCIPFSGRSQHSRQGENKHDMRCRSPQERIMSRLKDVEQANANLIREALDIAGGNKGEAAELLGVSRKTLYNMIHKYHLDI